MYLMLSQEELKEVLKDLEKLLPNREVFQAYYPTVFSFDFGSNCDNSKGKYKYKGKLVSLEEEIKMFFSIYEWRIGKGKYNLIKHRPPYYQILIEKISKKDSDTQFSKEITKIKKSFYKAGILPSMHIYHPISCKLILEEKRKEYWFSGDILHPDFCVDEIRKIKGKKKNIELLINPGFYSGNKKDKISYSYNSNGDLLIIEIDPEDIKGRYNNCKICRGKNYKSKEKVKFLFVNKKYLKPLACEYCIDEYLNQLSKAFKK